MMRIDRKKAAGRTAVGRAAVGRAAGALACSALTLSLLAGCVDQSGSADGQTGSVDTAAGSAGSVETLLEITDPQEKAAVEAAKAKGAARGGEPRITAPSPATADICDRLELDLVGVCTSTISSLPERYAEVEQV